MPFQRLETQRNRRVVIEFLIPLGCFLVSKSSNLKRFPKTRDNLSEAIKMINRYWFKHSIRTQKHVQILIDFVSSLALCVSDSPRSVLSVSVSRVPLHRSPLSLPSFIISQSIQDASSCSPDVERNTASKNVGVSVYMCVSRLLSDLCFFFFLKICNEKIVKRVEERVLRGHQRPRLWRPLFYLM